MAQSPIREYDGKKMLSEFLGTTYEGYLIQSESDMDYFEKNARKDITWVIKPDELFGKRGKYGLVGVNLSIAKVREWWEEKKKAITTIGKKAGVLKVFLIEPFVRHNEEHYISITTDRDHDTISYSPRGGIEVEENWDLVKIVKIGLEKTENRKQKTENDIRNQLDVKDDRIIDFISNLYEFFVEYGFSYLEINPFTFDSSGNIICLDMVARMDTCESFKQKKQWGELSFPHPFGEEKTEAEKYIEELDASTGASLKLRILNPDGNIWLLTSGGGASVIIADTIGDLGFAKEVGNYGECSGNPDRENTFAYTKTLLECMLSGNGVGPKYLIIAGAIANFTHIDKTFGGIIDAFREKSEEMKKQNVHILVRRGGINDTKGLQMMKDASEELGLRCDIADGNVYMTDILKKIAL